MKRAISLRKKADSKARLYAQRLFTALQDANLAARAMNQMNQLYNVDVSTKTLLTAELTRNLDLNVLSNALAGSTPGEELVLFNLIPDNGNGSELGSNWLLDGLARPPLTITKLEAQRNLVGGWNVLVAAQTLAGVYQLTNDLTPAVYDVEDNQELSFTLSTDGSLDGQTVRFVFTDALGNQVNKALVLV
jgi:hypothetical protein